MKNKKIWITAIIVVAAVGAFLGFRGSAKDKAQYFTAPVQRGDIRSVVEATGTINAVTTVQVGSQVSGTIDKLNADFNSQVKKGQVIARIDPSIFQGNLLQAKADLENARANSAAAQANVEKAKATALQAKADYDRTAALAKEGVMSQQQLDLAKATSDSAQAAVSAANAQLVQAKAQTSQKAAAVQVAQTNLDHTIIVAPIDGTVVARSVDVGQTVAASLQAPTLFTIAQDLTKMQVYAKTDESDVGNIRAGQPVSFKVDAFPNQTFTGTVHEVRMDATVVQNVVTYDTIVDFDNPERKLFPGMTAYVSIPVASANNVLKVPNGALRYKPDLKPDELKALYAKYGIDAGRGGQSDGSSSPAGDQSAAVGQPQGSRGGGSGQRNGKGGSANGKGGPGAGQIAGAAQGGAAATPQGNAAGQSGNGGGSGRAQSAVVWKLLPDKTLQPVKVRTGITDYTFTALINGDLKEGDELITGSSAARPSSSQSRLPGTGGPAAGGPRR